jgi:hypothetical protein
LYCPLRLFEESSKPVAHPYSQGRYVTADKKEKVQAVQDNASRKRLLQAEQVLIVTHDMRGVGNLGANLLAPEEQIRPALQKLEEFTVWAARIL